MIVFLVNKQDIVYLPQPDGFVIISTYEKTSPYRDE